VPMIPEAPGSIRWTGPEIGQHTDEVLRELLGMSPEGIAGLRTKGVIR
jgi:crotonobetainyl-CoA:carnitine CoA-transferase CaiB-like acyl-CoA transferase